MADEAYTRKPVRPVQAGDRFGRLTVLRRTGSDRYRNSLFECACECGNTTIIQGSALRRGISKSCGCYMRTHGIKHGLSYYPEYKTWQAIHQRCSNPNDCNFHHYGGRGITVCERWSDVKAFIEDMGPRPTPYHSIERIDNDSGYSPENCVWATQKAQANNRRKNLVVTFNGQRMTVAAACDIAELKRYVVYHRIRRGWPESRWFERVRHYR